MASCRNDDPKRRVKGVLDPTRPDEIAYYYDWRCAGGDHQIGCPPGYYASRKWSETGDTGGYCFGDAPLFGSYAGTRDKIECRRSPDSYHNDTKSLIQCCTDPSDAVQKECYPGFCPYSANCNNLMASSCSVRFLDGEEETCKAWCMNNPGQCDAGAINYCNRFPKDPFCACIKSPSARPGSGALALPGCFDGKCIAEGYHLQTMLDADCPQVCQQAVNCWQTTGGSCTIDNNQFQLTCGSSLPEIPPPAPVTPAPPPRPPTPVRKITIEKMGVIEYAKSHMWYAAVIFIIFIAAMAIIFNPFSRKNIAISRGSSDQILASSTG